MKNGIVIFTDGASRGNPGPGGYGTVLVVHGRVVELGGREDRTTNNRMEIQAAIAGLDKVTVDLAAGEVITVYTDSRYLINGITKWVFGWQKNGWITGAKEEVSNRDQWEELYEITRKIKAVGGKIEWTYIGGHKGIVGNERCDEIATSFADNKEIRLYDGTLAAYGSDILNVDVNPEKAEATSSSKSRKGAKAYSYLSFLDGKAERHDSWPACEARVKGKSGAKFKKALNAEEEREILASWGARM